METELKHQVIAIPKIGEALHQELLSEHLPIFSEDVRFPVYNH